MTAKPRILVLNSTCLDVIESHREWIEAQGVEVVASDSFRHLKPKDLDSLLPGTYALVSPPPISSRQMEQNPDLQVISIAASGYEWLNIEAATRCGIVVTNAPVREGAEVVADLTWGLMLAVARQIPYHHQVLREGRFERGMGVSVWGKTLGIVGLGQIGMAVARRAAGFSMRVLATTLDTDMDFVRQHHIELVPLEELLRESDFISLHVRLNGETEGMIGRRELEMMRPSAFLINTARARRVQEDALAEALLAGRIAGAAVDERPQHQNSPLLNLPNFVCTPHVGNRAYEGVHAVCRCALENALDVLQGRRPAYVLNPQVYEGPLRAPLPMPSLRPSI